MGWPRVLGEILGKHAEEHVFGGGCFTAKGGLAAGFVFTTKRHEVTRSLAAEFLSAKGR